MKTFTVELAGQKTPSLVRAARYEIQNGALVFLTDGRDLLVAFGPNAWRSLKEKA